MYMCVKLSLENLKPGTCPPKPHTLHPTNTYRVIITIRMYGGNKWVITMDIYIYIYIFLVIDMIYDGVMIIIIVLIF